MSSIRLMTFVRPRFGLICVAGDWSDSISGFALPTPYRLVSQATSSISAIALKMHRKKVNMRECDSVAVAAVE